MGKFKFFKDFTLESEIYKIVYTKDNYNNWLELNPGRDNQEFIKQIHSSLEQLSRFPDKSIFTQESLNDYLGNFDVYNDSVLREKVVKLLLREFNPNYIFKSKGKKFDWTDFKHSKVEEGERWEYNDIVIIRPDTWSSFVKLDELNMPDNLVLRQKHNYVDFYGEKKFNTFKTIYGVAFYFVNYSNTGIEMDDSKTLLFMVIPHQVNIELISRIKYNSILLNPNEFFDNIYVMGEEKPDLQEVNNLIDKYDLEKILMPLPLKKSLLHRILTFDFKNKNPNDQ